MKVRVLKKTSPKESRIHYESEKPTVSIYITFVTLPVEDFSPEDYLGSNIKRSSTVPSCGDNATTSEKNYCWLVDKIKNSGVKYSYYTGHLYSWSDVLKKKVGNCCDLTRLVNQYCGTKGMTRRYVTGLITVGGNDYYHVWNEILVNNSFIIFDPVSLLLGKGVGNVYGYLKAVTGYVSSAQNPC
ncbi:MAG: transglutaminase domain-containing protein [Candidatus Thermoplasmatota archaeon]|nr:transglutaminase domain-containing protein [Candidatus Thermoplasmatota archaeon]